MPSNLQNLLRGLLVVGFYAVAFWRVEKRNRGSRVIEFGGISLMLAVALGVLLSLNTPGWLLGCLGILLLLMCFLTVGLFIREIYLEIRHKFRNRAEPPL